jgi:hypothetical protein
MCRTQLGDGDGDGDGDGPAELKVVARHDT